MDNESRFNDIIKHLTFNCTGVPQPVAERALIEAMRDLAKKTKSLKSQVIVSGLQDGVADYDYKDDLPQGYSVCELRWVMWCGCKLNRVDECDHCPHGYEVITRNCIRIHPCPDCPDPGDLKLGVTLQPDFDLCEIPDELLEHEEMIIDGAMSKLMRQPKKTWSDARLARQFASAFNSKLTGLRGQVEREHSADGCRARHGFF